MSYSVFFFIFALGACVGSFINVVIYRSLQGLSPLKGRSFCDRCKRQLTWYENIPVISFLVLRGKCRTCDKKIDWTYPLVEFLGGVLFLWWGSLGFAFFQLTQSPMQVIQPIFWLLVGVLLLIIFFADLQYFIIPDATVIALTAITLLYRLTLTSTGIMNPIDFFLTVSSGVASVAFFLSLFLITKGKGLGFGDVKFAFPMGLLLGYPRTIVGIFLSFVIGGVFGAILLVTGKKKIGQKVPFGPFLIIGLVLALVFGESIWQWYWHLTML